jgi:hypothetical protein
MAGFVQIIEYRTSRPEEVRALTEQFRKGREAGDDGPAPTRMTACADRHDSEHYFHIVEFASYEDAMANSKREDTSAFAASMMELCDGPTTFHNLDLLETTEMG